MGLPGTKNRYEFMQLSDLYRTEQDKVLDILEPESQEVMLQEVMPLAEAGYWEEYDEAWEAWLWTAEVLQDSKLVYELNQPWNEEDEMEILRP